MTHSTKMQCSPIIEQIKNSQKTKQEKKLLLLKRENKLQTMILNELNRELNNV